MKTNCAKPGAFRRRLGLLVSASALCLLGLTALGQATPKSPVGTWGCVMSGSREGLASLTFFADGTFGGYEILVPKLAVPPKPNNELRNGDDPESRFPGAGSTNTATVQTNITLFGYQDPVGLWGYDSRGRVIGCFYEYSNPGSPPVITNALSFVGTVVPGKRLSLLVTTPNGKVTYRGVPDVLLPDLSGSWYGIEREGSRWYTEFFTLTNASLGNNLYWLDGSGPGYTLTGLAMLTPQKKLALVTTSFFLFDDSLIDARAVVGPANLKRLSGSLHGLKHKSAGPTQRLTYSMQHQ